MVLGAEPPHANTVVFPVRCIGPVLEDGCFECLNARKRRGEGIYALRCHSNEEPCSWKSLSTRFSLTGRHVVLGWVVPKHKRKTYRRSLRKEAGCFLGGHSARNEEGWRAPPKLGLSPASHRQYQRVKFSLIKLLEVKAKENALMHISGELRIGTILRSTCFARFLSFPT